ncbi:hypothetical protein H632_c3299p0, partial [Helicosporidium sp. ATCC 50920]
MALDAVPDAVLPFWTPAAAAAGAGKPAGATPQSVAALVPAMIPGGTGAGSSSSYRQREATQFRGVTRTSGTNSGMEKYDLQLSQEFVFCDNGTKKHPKVYGFHSAEAAARAFDLLTCKRFLERGRGVAAAISALGALGINLAPEEYASESLQHLLASCSRDDLVYALKACAKKGCALSPSTLETDLAEGLVQARLEASARRDLGEE